MSNIIDINSKEELGEFLKNEEGLVFVDFWAPWCGPCKSLMSTFEGIKGDVEGFTLAKINVDNNQELALEFGVRTVPSVFVYKNNNELFKFSGAKTKPELIEMIEKNK